MILHSIILDENGVCACFGENYRDRSGVEIISSSRSKKETLGEPVFTTDMFA